MEEKDLELLKRLSKSQTLPSRIVKGSKMLSYYLWCNNKRKTSRDLNLAGDLIYNRVGRWTAALTARAERWEASQQELITQKEYLHFLLRYSLISPEVVRPISLQHRKKVS